MTSVITANVPIFASDTLGHATGPEPHCRTRCGPSQWNHIHIRTRFTVRSRATPRGRDRQCESFEPCIVANRQELLSGQLCEDFASQTVVMCLDSPIADGSRDRGVREGYFGEALVNVLQMTLQSSRCDSNTTAARFVIRLRIASASRTATMGSATWFFGALQHREPSATALSTALFSFALADVVL